MSGGAGEFRDACILLRIGHLPVPSTLIEMEGGAGESPAVNQLPIRKRSRLDALNRQLKADRGLVAPLD